MLHCLTGLPSVTFGGENHYSILPVASVSPFLNQLSKSDLTEIDHCSFISNALWLVLQWKLSIAFKFDSFSDRHDACTSIAPRVRYTT